MAMKIVAIRQAASTRARKDWAADYGEVIERLSPLKKDLSSFAHSYASRMLKGPINKKKTSHLGNLMSDLGDNDDALHTKLLLYSKKDLSTADELCTDFAKQRSFPAEWFTKLEILVLKFQQTNVYTPNILQCSMKNGFRKQGPRNHWVWIVAGTKDQYGALRDRLPAILQCLFKLRNPCCGITLQLALLHIIQAQLGAGRLQDESCLVKVSERQSQDGSDKRIVGIDHILGIAHLIPDIDVPGEYWVNSRINMETINEIY